MPLVRRTRATFRRAELGFFGVVVYTRVHTPRFCGQDCNAGLDVRYRFGCRPSRTSWLKVGTLLFLVLLLGGQSLPSYQNPGAHRQPRALVFPAKGTKHCRVQRHTEAPRKTEPPSVSNPSFRARHSKLLLKLKKTCFVNPINLVDVSQFEQGANSV